MNLTKMKKKKGFTLIELMAVIAIIAILAAVLVPTVTGYINRSKKTAIITQVRNAVTAIETHNATAVGADAISDNSTLLVIVGEGTASKHETILEDGFLTKNDIDRLGRMTVKVAKAINSDVDAMNNIAVSSDGTILSYDGAGTENDWVNVDSPDYVNPDEE